MTPILAFALAGIVLAVLIVRAARKSSEPFGLLVKWGVTLLLIGILFIPIYLRGGIRERYEAVVIPFYCVFMGVALSIMWSRHIGSGLGAIMSGGMDGGSEPPQARPNYSPAQARRRQQRFPEALMEVEEQLKKFPDDFEGLMLKATIHAEGLNDLPGAEALITAMCNRSKGKISPQQMSGALHTLADWQLKYGQDPESARRSLEKVMAAMPDTELAQMAAQRMAHLASVDQILETHDRRKLKVVEGSRRLGLEVGREVEPASAEEPEMHARIRECLEQLKEHPSDHGTRERLALIYAEECHQPMLAVLELQELLREPHLSPRQAARWYHLLADIQSRKMGQADAARQTLEQLQERFPSSAIAEAAMKRVQLLGLESRGQTQTSKVAMAEFERNLGIKWAREKGEGAGDKGGLT